MGSLKEAEQLIDEGAIHDAKTIIAIFKYIRMMRGASASAVTKELTWRSLFSQQGVDCLQVFGAPMRQ